MFSGDVPPDDLRGDRGGDARRLHGVAVVGRDRRRGAGARGILGGDEREGSGAAPHEGVGRADDGRR